MNNLELYTEKVFEDIKHIDEDGQEYWLARELQVVLDYKKWERFHNAIKLAKAVCENSGYLIFDHFPEAGKMIETAKGAKRKITDYKLSRYACYLIAQNGDSRKKVIALAQTYFAIQTRKQELSEKEYANLTEDEKRMYQRNLTRKGLRYREDILDNMGSEELVDNLFRITHTEQKLKREMVKGEENANDIHYQMGKDIRVFIAKQGGTMPEELPTPKKSLKELEKEKKASI